MKASQGMFDHAHYVPVMKCKQGERLALGQLLPTAGGKATPLIEVDDIPRSPETDEHTRTLAEHCESQLDQGLVTWGQKHAFFLDPEELSPYAGGAQQLYAEATKQSLNFMPVVGLRRTQAELAAAANHRQRGTCLRLDDNDFTPSLQGGIVAFLGAHSLRAQDTDLVIDLGAVYQTPLQRVFTVALAYLNALPNIKTWRTLTLTASAFPESMGELKGSSSATFPRLEWQSWAHLHTQRGLLQRMPSFGDYGVQHPEMAEGLDFRVVQVSAALRYTIPSEWLIIKGQGLRNVKGSVQFPQLAKLLTSHPAFMGSEHCQGCADAVACAAGKAGFSSSSSWRRIGAVHHVTVAVGQLAALPYP